MIMEWADQEFSQLDRFHRGSQMIGIFELADLFGITTEALRKYEARKILQPHRGENNYRKYSSWELTKIIRVRQLRQAGLSLEDISDELEWDGPAQRRRKLEDMQEQLRREIAYREKLIHWMDAQRDEMLSMEKLGDGCAIEKKGRQYCCVYMVKDTLVDKKGQERDRLKEWVQALPFARVYYINGLQEDTLSCLSLTEEELKRYGLQHLVPDFVLPAHSYVVCNITSEHRANTITTEESFDLARQRVRQMGLELSDQMIQQMVWYTYRDEIFRSHNKALIPILDPKEK